MNKTQPCESAAHSLREEQKQHIIISKYKGFLCSLAGKESIFNAGGLGLIPGYIDAYYLTLLKAHKKK